MKIGAFVTLIHTYCYYLFGLLVAQVQCIELNYWEIFQIEQLFVYCVVTSPNYYIECMMKMLKGKMLFQMIFWVNQNKNVAVTKHFDFSFNKF